MSIPNYQGLQALLLTAPYSGLTQAAQVAKANADTVTSSNFSISGAAIFNAIVPADWVALTATQQQMVAYIFGLGPAINASPGTNVYVQLTNIFAGKQTLANLSSLVSTTQSVAQSLGWPAGIAVNDILAAQKWAA